MANPKWKKGMASPNPKGRDRGMSAFQMQLREDHDPAEMSAIVKAIYTGQPFVRVLDTATGLPRLASAPIRSEDSPGYERPKPASMLKPGERVVEVVYPTPAEQLAAIKFVGEYTGWKPANQSEVNMNVNHTAIQEADLENLDDEQLEQYLNLCNILQKAKNANVEEEPFSSGSHFIEAESSVKEDK